MADLNIYITTFNCGRKPVDIDHFAANFFNGLQTDLPPDLICLSLQEIAPIGYSFLGGSLLAPYLASISEAVHRAAEQRLGKDSSYVSVITRNLGLTALVVFARPGIENKIRWLETGGVGAGLWEMGNKGAVGVRMGLGRGGEETAVTFVSAHLAPMEEAWQRRNQDWKSICEGLVFERIHPHGRTAGQKTVMHSDEQEQPLLSSSDVASLFSPPTHLFFAGDLNYRASDAQPNQDTHPAWPQPVPDSSDPQHFSHHLSADQLARERSAGRTLHHLSEHPINFPPTYKYSSAAQKSAKTARDLVERTLADGRVVHTTTTRPQMEEPEVYLWAQHRTPSWCDRILYLAPAKVASYTALPVQPTSDHRPVALSCSVPFRKPAEVEEPFKVRADWRERRAAARRLEVLVGVASYLALTWEGEALLVGTVVGILGGWLVLKALIGS